MRQFIRHPTDIPIEIQHTTDSSFVEKYTQNISHGGLELLSETPIEPGTLIALRVSLLQPVFEVSAARVIWCQKEGSNFAIGVEFLDSEEAYQVRMVEQICHIENYRRETERREGRQLTAKAAAEEWISRYASSFPNP